ncbi:MAG: M1 family metallopeptidase [Fulvivirga sp.]|uniref:M1 family metallopeptidase n=1 Tax=Fulvivirga sp. TaxID=1931237 RepID=UPI0032EFEB48
MNYKIFVFLLAIAACNSKSEMSEETNKADEVIPVKDPHSFALPSESVIKHLSWNAEVDFEKKTISGVATFNLKNDADANKLVLDTKELNVTKVTDANGNDLEFNLGEKVDHLGSPLEIKIAPETTTVAIHYSTSPGAEALQWLDPVQTADKNSPFLFTQSQAILARSWVPVQDSPGIRFTYEAEVTVPKGLMALMSAENPTETNETGVYTFKMDQAIPAYLLALAVGELEFKRIGARSGVYAEPSVVEKAAYEFGELEEMISAAEELYGPYQWEEYDIIVLPPSFPFGGMENPRLTFATPTILAGDRSLTSLVAHELAHSWSGNLVTNATWNDFWLNEGFTVYFEQRIMEKLYGRAYSEMLASLSAQDLKTEIQDMIANGSENDTRLKLELEGRNPDDGVTSIAYDKGYLFLRSIEEEVGRERFDAFLKMYFNDNAFEGMTTEGFLERLENDLYKKNNLTFNKEKAEQWIYQSGLPENAPAPQSDKFALVDAEWEKLKAGSTPLDLNTSEWSSHEWLHFVRSIPEEYTAEQMKMLDTAFKFTNTGNSEVLTAWLVKSISKDYTPAYNRLEEFLVNTGRRKFLMPLYEEMIKTDKGTAMAKDIYAKARPNYHFVSTNSIDALLKDK